MRLPKLQMLTIIIPVTAGLLIVAYLMIPRPPCDSIFEQSAPNIAAKIQFIKTKGSLVISPAQVQTLSEGAQKVALHLKTCCLAQINAHMSVEQLQMCIDGAKDYETRIVQVTNLIDRAQASRQQGNPQLANERSAEAAKATEAASDAARHLGEVVSGISAGEQPLPPGAKATILPLTATSSPLRAITLPLKATILPAERSAR